MIVVVGDCAEHDEVKAKDSSKQTHTGANSAGAHCVNHPIIGPVVGCHHLRAVGMPPSAIIED